MEYFFIISIEFGFIWIKELNWISILDGKEVIFENKDEERKDIDIFNEIKSSSFMKNIEFTQFNEMKIWVEKNNKFNSFLNIKEYIILIKIEYRKNSENGSLKKI